MNPMAVNTDGNLCVSLGEEPAMDAGLVLAQLVRAQGWIVLAHKRGVGVATPAEFRHVFAVDLSTETCGFAHGVHVRFGGIAAMTTRASEALLRVNVACKLLFGDLKGRIHAAVADEAGVLRPSADGTAQRQRYQNKEPRLRCSAISPHSHRRSSL
jgi:hypothetical protein